MNNGVTAFLGAKSETLIVNTQIHEDKGKYKSSSGYDQGCVRNTGWLTVTRWPPKWPWVSEWVSEWVVESITRARFIHRMRHDLVLSLGSICQDEKTSPDARKPLCLSTVRALGNTVGWIVQVGELVGWDSPRWWEVAALPPAATAS